MPKYIRLEMPRSGRQEDAVYIKVLPLHFRNTLKFLEYLHQSTKRRKSFTFLDIASLIPVLFNVMPVDMDEEQRPLDRSPYYVTHSEHLDRVLSRPQLAGKSVGQ
jgi:hypothetical protein